MRTKLNLAIIFIQDDNGRYFVHQRASFKIAFPNLYGLGAGGHIENNEEPAVGAARELFEETGLKVPLQHIATENYMAPEFYETAHLYLAISNDDLKTDELEWQWSGWMTKAQVHQLYLEKKLCPDTALLYSKYFATDVHEAAQTS